MKRLFGTPQAHYASNLPMASLAVPQNARGLSFKVFVALALVFMFAFTALANPVSALSQQTVAADENEDTLNDALGDYGTGTDFEKTLNKYDKEGYSGKDNDFGYLIDRLFTLRYLNNTENGVGADGEERDWNCDVNATGAGTPYYHNCDVPNIVTEFTQDVLSMFTSQGISGGNVESVTLANSWFGLPSNIPNNGDVPVDADSRSDKYTALELYGYNMRYTAYYGEWDHIKVYTAARAMANFGFMDNIRLGARSILNGITGGVEKSAENMANELSQGDILGAIGGAWSGLFSGSTAGALNVVVDSSDLNVFNTFAWYRVGYGSTLYGARELTEEELSEVAKNSMLDALGGLTDDDAKLPEDFTQLQTPPDKPKEAISSCDITYKDGDKETKKDITEKECDSEENSSDVNDTTWSEDGTQKKESLKDWRDANKKWFEAAKKYDLGCSIDFDDEDKRADNLATFYSCIPDAYSKAARDQGEELKKKSVDELVESSITARFFVDLLMSQEGNKSNYNAPWYRYVCTKPDGSDMQGEDGYSFEYLLFSDGTMNDACSDVRAPIQNGYFGNGYDGSQQEVPKPDTRNTMVDSSAIALLFNPTGMGNYYSNLNLGIASFATQTSNAILNLSFSPVLDTLGIDDMVEDLIGDFRDSIFFPFAVLVIMFSAFYTLAMVLRTRSYRDAFKTILCIIGVFLGGTILMYKPATIMNLADNVPSKVETAIMGTVFSLNDVNDDELCTASGSGGNSKEEGLEGEELDNAPEDSVRTMMCENWRVFLFNPWLYGQWGTDFDNLYSAESGETNAMTNTNGSLVGDATVNMGNGVEVQNWSLYQLDQMAAGTATTHDYTQGSGMTDSDMYRLVDLQAGPNNGEGTDSRYFQMWSGHDVGARAGASFMSAAVSILGLIVMTIYGLTKVIVSFLTALMLIILPMIFLLGLIPNAGFSKLKQYFGTLGGLILQRIMLVLLLAMMIRILSMITGASDGYMMNMMGAAIVCVCFLLFRKNIMDLIMKIATMDMGAMVTGSGVKNAVGNAIPKSVKNYANLQGNRLSSAASGAIGGFMVGGRAGVKDAVKDSVSQENRKLLNKQRTQGFGLGQSARFAADTAKGNAIQELRTSPNKGDVKDSVSEKLDERVSNAYNGDEPLKDVKSPRGNVDTTSKKTGKPIPPKARDARIMSRLQKAESDLQDAKEKAKKPIVDEKDEKSLLNHPQARRIKKAQEAISEENEKRTPRLKRAEKNFESALNSAVDAEAKRHESAQANSEFRDSLSNLRNVYKDEHEAKREQRREERRARKLEAEKKANELRNSKESSNDADGDTDQGNRADNTNDDKSGEQSNDREV